MATLAPGSRETVTKEYRFAVVMYGGVSLAVYMNGIAQELLSLVRSTALETSPDPDPQMLSDLKGTEEVYRKLAERLSEEKDGRVHVQFVIDIISGTSAGGINGIFLAKALATRKDMLSLKQTWIEEGDFKKLLNDQSYKDSSINLPKQTPPHSLLSGESMYLRLFEAFAKMDEKPGETPAAPYSDEINLWVTTTDLYGAVLPLRLTDRVVFERKYKQKFYLRYSSELELKDAKGNLTPRNDFKRDNTPFLAFAARCTSSFPVAFEPMQLTSISRLLPFSRTFVEGKYDSTSSQWEGFFGPPDPKVPNADRYFADGGYLDNHPFDHAIEGLLRQSSSVRSSRKLLYIEPSPEHPERDNAVTDHDGKIIQPDAIENAWDALSAIPGKQPIRDSLIDIQRRNRLIRKVNGVISEISSVIGDSQLTQTNQNADPKQDKEGRSQVNKDAWKTLLDQPGFRAYNTLNIYSVTDDLAKRIAQMLQLDEHSDYVFAIRCLMRAWRRREYPDEKNFLLDFDISYRIRRYRFVKSQLELLSQLTFEAQKRMQLAKVDIPADDSQRLLFRNEMSRLRGVFDESLRKLRTTSALAQQASDIKDKIQDVFKSDKTFNGLEGLNVILGVNSPVAAQKVLAPLPVTNEMDPDQRAEEMLTDDLVTKLKAVKTAIVDAYRGPIREARGNVESKIQFAADDTPMRRSALTMARLYFYGFQEFDAATFPIIYGTDVGELEPVEVLRVSPEDAVAIVDEAETGRQKLAGTAFGDFGAFLERVWRTNDILWGRLDGAERIIRALGPPNIDVDDLIRAAHDTIIEEELTPANSAEICQMLVDSLLANRSGATADERREALMKAVETCTQGQSGGTDVNPRLVAVLRRALTTDQIRCCLQNYEISREPNRENTLQSVARSARIIGRILDDMSSKRPALKKPGTILIQAGNVFWGLVEVSIPGSIWGSFFNYWFSLLLLFSVIMIVGGTFLSPPVQALGFRLLALALTTRLAVETLRRFNKGDKRWWRTLEIVFILCLLALLGLGIIELNNLTADWAARLQHVQDGFKQFLGGK